MPFGLPEIGVWHMFGIIITMSLVMPYSSATGDIKERYLKPENERAINHGFMSVLVTTMALVLGWLAHLMAG